MSKSNLPALTTNAKNDEKYMLSVLTDPTKVTSLSLMNKINQTINVDCISIQDFVQKYKVYINDEIANNFKRLSSEFIYATNINLFIGSIMREFIINEPTNDILNEMMLNLLHLLEEYKVNFFLTLEVKLREIRLLSESRDDYQVALYDFFKSKNHIEFSKYMTNLKYQQYETYDKIVIKHDFLPKNIRSFFGEITLNADTNLTIKDFVKYHKQNRNKKFTDVDTNKLLHKVIYDKQSRIMELYNLNYSYNKIQKVLTEECISEGLIPAKIDRYIRKKDSKNNKGKVPTKLSLSIIKQIISDNKYENIIDCDIVN